MLPLPAFFDELEKIALYDPDIHTTPEKIKRLQRMEDLKLQHRIRTTGAKVTPTSGGEAIKRIKSPSDLNLMTPGYVTTREGEVLVPKGSFRNLNPLSLSAPVSAYGIHGRTATSGAHRVLTHHELDELRAMQGTVGRSSPTGASPFAHFSSAGEAQVNSIPRPIRGPVMRTYAKIKRQLPESIQKGLSTVGALPRLSAPGPGGAAAIPLGVHMDPAILVQESNRVAQLPPAERARMMAIRKKSTESSILGRHGLRYGEEVIPESGRRFEKLRSAVSSEAPKRLEALKKVEGVGVKIREKFLAPLARRLLKH